MFDSLSSGKNTKFSLWEYLRLPFGIKKRELPMTILFLLDCIYYIFITFETTTCFLASVMRMK